MEWDVSSFGNDGAQNWLRELVQSKTGEPVRHAIEAVDRSDSFVDAQDAEIAIAAAEVVAASRGYAASELPPEVILWVKSQKYHAPDQIALRATVVVARILTSSELRDLWEGTDAADRWLGLVRDLLDRLKRSEAKEETGAKVSSGASAADALTYFNDAVDLVSDGAHEAALEKYNQALELEPTFVVGYIGRGTSLLALGKFDEALDDFNKAIDLDPEVPEAYHLRAQAYFQTGKTGRAIADLSILINMDGNRAEAYLLRGIANADLGRHAKAIDDFSKAIELNPQLQNAYLHRAQAYEHTGRFDLAGKDMKQFERITGTTRSL